MPAPIRYILLLSLLNPAAWIVGAALGRRADQPQKLVVAGFIAGIAAVALAGLSMATGFVDSAPRLLAGVFIVSAMVGTAAAWLGWRTRAR